MRVERRCVINADRDAVWKVVSDPDCYPSFMPSLERRESSNDLRRGVGARYTVALEGRLGAGRRFGRGGRIRRRARLGLGGHHRCHPARADPAAQRRGRPNEGDVPAVISGARWDIRLHRRPHRRASGGPRAGRNPEMPQGAYRVIVSAVIRLKGHAPRPSDTEGSGEPRHQFIFGLFAALQHGRLVIHSVRRWRH